MKRFTSFARGAFKGTFAGASVATQKKQSKNKSVQGSFLWTAALLLGLSVCGALFCFTPLLQKNDLVLVEPDLNLMLYLKMDVNCADAETLCLLPGVGPEKAEKILAYRRENGPFVSMDELSLISGITEQMVEEWRDLAYVGKEAPQ